MKKCPKCAVEYADDTLEFCLEDGSRLAEKFRATNIVPVVFDEKINTAQEFETAVLPEINTRAANLNERGKIPKTFDISETDSKKAVSKIKEKFNYQGLKLIEILPIIIALSHNYWHWLYYDKSKFSTFIGFLLSGTFIIWIILLISGILASLTALKYGKNRGFAIVALVILAINLLLGVVPLK